MQLNPLTPAFELFQRALLGEGLVTTPQVLWSGTFTIGLLVAALLVFNKQVGKLIDVV